MTPARRRSFRALVAVAAIAALVAGLLGHSSIAGRRPAPALPTGLVNGPRVTLAQLRGHAAAVIFWATWCTDCRAEAAAVERFARSAAGRGRIVGVDYSDGGPWRTFLHTYDWSFPVFSDPDGSTLDAYGVSVGLPATVILNSHGQIVQTSHRIQTVALLRTELTQAG
jgi:thiol-disulfide isomerase/thioredoxin